MCYSRNFYPPFLDEWERAQGGSDIASCVLKLRPMGLQPANHTATSQPRHLSSGDAQDALTLASLSKGLEGSTTSTPLCRSLGRGGTAFVEAT